MLAVSKNSKSPRQNNYLSAKHMSVWNSLPDNIWNPKCISADAFRRSLKTFLFLQVHWELGQL